MPCAPSIKRFRFTLALPRSLWGNGAGAYESEMTCNGHLLTSESRRLSLQELGRASRGPTEIDCAQKSSGSGVELSCVSENGWPTGETALLAQQLLTRLASHRSRVTFVTSKCQLRVKLKYRNM